MTKMAIPALFVLEVTSGKSSFILQSAWLLLFLLCCNCLERPGKIEGFDKAAFKKDILEIIGALLQQAA